MFLKKNKYYIITWSCGSDKTEHYTEIEKAKNKYEAFVKIRRRYSFPIHLITIQEVEK